MRLVVAADFKLNDVADFLELRHRIFVEFPKMLVRLAILVFQPDVGVVLVVIALRDAEVAVHSGDQQRHAFRRLQMDTRTPVSEATSSRFEEERTIFIIQLGSVILGRLRVMQGTVASAFLGRFCDDIFKLNCLQG